MKKIVNYYIKLEDFLTNTLMIGVVFFVFIAAVLRWFGHPIAWTVGFAEFIFVWVIFLGANKALRLNQHIGVDFFVKRLPKKPQMVIETFSYFVIIAFLVYLSIKGIGLSMDNFNRKINNIALSYSFVTMAVPIGSLLMSITLTNKIYVNVLKLKVEKE